MMKVLFAGSRSFVFEAALKLPSLEIVHVLALEGYAVHRVALEHGLSVRPFTLDDREDVLREIEELDFDLMISNGFPIVVPVSKIARPHQFYTNVHPSYLPHLRGKHPVNGVFLLNYKFAGSTMHFMADKVDRGNIIAQEKLDITDDLDLGLLYQMLFQLEVDVFHTGVERLLTEPDFKGTPQQGEGSYYNREESDMVVDFAAMEDEQILLRVRAFGTQTQGVTGNVAGRKLRIFDAEPVLHSFLINRHSGLSPGEVAESYDGKIVVKSKNGLIKLKSFREEAS